jgi:hypothetical protein
LSQPPPLIRLGLLLAAPGALEFIQANNIDIQTLVHRHASSDDGELCAEDKAANQSAFQHGSRIFSSYRCVEGIADGDGGRLCIITEADRASTTVLLPSKYYFRRCDIRTGVEAAYDRNGYKEKRRGLLQDWAAYLYAAQTKVLSEAVAAAARSRSVVPSPFTATITEAIFLR